MTSYATEHARSRSPSPSATNGPPRRPDLSTFFTTLSEISTQPDRARQHAVPVPGDVSAAYRSLAEAFEVMRRDIDRQGTGGREGGDGELLQGMIEALLQAAERPPKEVEGVDEEYIAQLDRVDIKKISKDKDCPICGNAFHDDPHPLIVRLPCHTTHIFDLECIRPWLLLNGTCPLDRADLAQRERDRKQKLRDEIKKGEKEKGLEDEEEWDGMYG